MSTSTGIENQQVNDQTVNVDAVGESKSARGEKKFKKAMIKMGLKPVDEVFRVTLRTNKAFTMYIEPATVMKITDNSYAVFGEAKIHDIKSTLASKQAEKFGTAETAANAPKLNPIKEEEEDDNEVLEAGNLKEEDITNLMAYATVSRNKAIKALKETNGDVVEAITKLSG